MKVFKQNVSHNGDLIKEGTIYNPSRYEPEEQQHLERFLLEKTDYERSIEPVKLSLLPELEDALKEMTTDEQKKMLDIWLASQVSDDKIEYNPDDYEDTAPLKKICDEKGIEYPNNATRKKLCDLLNAPKEGNE